MPVLESFQSRSFRFSLEILKFYREVAKTDIPRLLPNQMVRAGTSVGANLEEAKSAYSRRDLSWKYRVALRESRECGYWLRLIKVDQPQLTGRADPLIKESGELAAMLTASVKKLLKPPVAET